MSWNNESPDDIANELDKFQEAFDAAPIPDDGATGGKVPDGDYQCQIKSVDVITSRKTGKQIVRWRFKILGPQFAGSELTMWNRFDDDVKLGWLKKYLAKVGISPNGLRLATLRERLLELDGRHVEVTAKTDGQYQNVFLNAASPKDTPF